MGNYIGWKGLTDIGWETGGLTPLAETVVTHDASSVATIDFTFLSSYDQYEFRYYNVNPDTDAAHWSFQVNDTADVGGDFDVCTATTANWTAYQDEAGSSSVGGITNNTHEIASSDASAFITLFDSCGNGVFESVAGALTIWGVHTAKYKIFQNVGSYTLSADKAANTQVLGYIFDTTPLDAIRFKFSSGSFTGIVRMYGVDYHGVS